MVRRIFKSRKGQVLTGLATVVLSAGIAFAAWSIVVGGGGQTKFGALQAPTLSNVAVLNGSLVPNSTAFTGSVQFKVTNPNSSPLYITAMNAPDLVDPNLTIVGGGPGCTWAIVKPMLTTQAFTAAAGAGIMVNGSGTSGGVTNVTIPAIFKAADNVPNDCQGATIDNVPAPNVVFSTTP